MLPVKEDCHIDVKDVSRHQRPGVRNPVRCDVIHCRKWILQIEEIKQSEALLPDVEMLFG